MAITTLVNLPNSVVSPTTFNIDGDAFWPQLNTFAAEANALAVAMTAVAAGGAVSLQYTFDSTTTDSDPGAGKLRLSSATQNASSVIRVDLTGADGSALSGVLDLIDDSTSTNKGYLKLLNATDATKWLVFSVASVASPSGYRNITATCAASSSASPFTNGDALLFDFTPTGDKGDTGLTGAAGANGTNGTNGVDGGITNIVSSSTNVTLTSTRTLVIAQPTSYGMSVYLNAPTGISASDRHHAVQNTGAYAVAIRNADGTLRGFCYPDGDVSVGATGSNAWILAGHEPVGASAQFLSANFNTAIKTIALDSDRDFIIGTKTSTAIYGKVHRKSTNYFSNDTIIRNANCAANIELILQATNQVLVVSCDATTGFEAVICSVDASTDAITPNAAATATLSASISSFADGCGLIAVGTSFITSYTVATPAAQIREITVSGTTATISAATVLDGTAGGLIVAGNATHVIAVSTTTTHRYTKPYTIGGLTPGTGTDTNSGTMTLNKLSPTGGGRWWIVYNDGGSTVNIDVLSLSGTTTSVTTATGFSAGTLLDAVIVGTTKLAIVNNQTTNNCNIITDSAGTAGAGTAITLSSQTARAYVYASGTNVVVYDGSNAGACIISTVDCSGSSPVQSAKTTFASSAAQFANVSPSNSMLNRFSGAVFGSNFCHVIKTNNSQTGSQCAIRINGGIPSTIYDQTPVHSGTTYRGKLDSEKWLSDGATITTKWECVA